jgi:hypothetical protein
MSGEPEDMSHVPLWLRVAGPLPKVRLRLTIDGKPMPTRVPDWPIEMTRERRPS